MKKSNFSQHNCQLHFFFTIRIWLGEILSLPAPGIQSKQSASRFPLLEEKTAFCQQFLIDTQKILLSINPPPPPSGHQIANVWTHGKRYRDNAFSRSCAPARSAGPAWIGCGGVSAWTACRWTGTRSRVAGGWRCGCGCPGSRRRRPLVAGAAGMTSPWSCGRRRRTSWTSPAAVGTLYRCRWDRWTFLTIRKPQKLKKNPKKFTLLPNHEEFLSSTSSSKDEKSHVTNVHINEKVWGNGLFPMVKLTLNWIMSVYEPFEVHSNINQRKIAWKMTADIWGQRFELLDEKKMWEKDGEKTLKKNHDEKEICVTLLNDCRYLRTKIWIFGREKKWWEKTLKKTMMKRKFVWLLWMTGKWRAFASLNETKGLDRKTNWIREVLIAHAKQYFTCKLRLTPRRHLIPKQNWHFSKFLP